MKILIANDGPTAFYYIRLGLARAFSASGHEVQLWNIDEKPANDAFDEVQPDLFLGQTYNMNRSTINAIKERPHMKVIMKAGDWGPLGQEIAKGDYGVLMASEPEKKAILDLYEETGKPDYVHIYYHPDYLERTHGGWLQSGVNVHSHMLGADVFDYTNGQRVEQFESDITFMGGYWPYKARNIDAYLLPLCLDYKYRIKIFGNSHWPVAQYCGFAPPEMARHILASATITPQLHEPHSTAFGFDTSERTFKLLANRCFCISDYVEGLDKLFGLRDRLVMARTPEEFKEMVDYYLKHPEKRQPYIDAGYKEVMDKHTYFHRVRDIFNNLGLAGYANKAMEEYDKIRKAIDEGRTVGVIQ
jgi:hypothetical protein